MSGEVLADYLQEVGLEESNKLVESTEIAHASALKPRLKNLQRVLKINVNPNPPPIFSATAVGNDTRYTAVSGADSSSQQALQGQLWKQNRRGEWQRRICEYDNGYFVYKSTPTGRPKILNVTFIAKQTDVKETPSAPSSTTPAAAASSAPPASASATTTAASSNLSQLAVSNLEKVRGSYSFQLWAPDRCYIFRCDTERERDLFVDHIANDLKEQMGQALFLEKQSAAQELEPLVRESYLYHVQQFEQYVKILADSGLVDGTETENALGSTNKQKSGALDLENQGHWTAYYFVLFRNTLFYYENHKDKEPAGFVTLRFASISFDPQRIGRSEYSFTLATPMRTLVLRTKHALALSEWVAAIESAIVAVSLEKSVPARTPQQVLEQINTIKSEAAAFELVLYTPQGVEAFSQYLKQTKKNSAELDFFRAVADFRTQKLTGTPLIQAAQRIIASFIQIDTPLASSGVLIENKVTNTKTEEKKTTSGSNSGSEPASPRLDMSQSLAKRVSNSMMNPNTQMFDNPAKIVKESLRRTFSAFKQTPSYQALAKQLNIGSGGDVKDSKATAKRDVAPFDPSHEQRLVITVPGGKPTTVALKKGKGAVTLGRDKSNDIVVNDARVSRSHCRLEYSDTECTVVDLGSSGGTKVNDARALRMQLQHGDVLSIGKSVIMFEVGKKKGLFGL